MKIRQFIDYYLLVYQSIFEKLPVHELIRNLHEFIASPDVIEAKMSIISTE